MMTMMISTLLTMALLGHPASTKPTHQKPEHKLKPIIDLFDSNMSLPTGDFDRLTHLAEGFGRCEAKFFCKVHELLNKTEETEEIARHLNGYNRQKEFQCKAVLQRVAPTGNKYQMPLLKEDLIKCIRYKIMRSSSSTTLPSTISTRPSQ